MPDLLVEDSHRSQKLDAMMRKSNEEDSSRLALQLATKTQEYKRHSQLGDDGKSANVVDDSELKKYLGMSRDSIGFSFQGLSPMFHQIELSDWESKISWEGCTHATLLHQVRESKKHVYHYMLTNWRKLIGFHSHQLWQPPKTTMSWRENRKVKESCFAVGGCPYTMDDQTH